MPCWYSIVKSDSLSVLNDRVTYLGTKKADQNDRLLNIVGRQTTEQIVAADLAVVVLVVADLVVPAVVDFALAFLLQVLLACPTL